MTLGLPSAELLAVLLQALLDPVRISLPGSRFDFCIFAFDIIAVGFDVVDRGLDMNPDGLPSLKRPGHFRRTTIDRGQLQHPFRPHETLLPHLKALRGRCNPRHLNQTFAWPSPTGPIGLRPLAIYGDC